MIKSKNENSDLFIIAGDWSKQSELLKKKFPQLTAEDIKLEPGKESALLYRVGLKLDKKRPEVISLLKGLKPV